ncbi:alpha/beta hydrolase [Novosphingopyxis iocasae]|uniref:alpha/beta hydrolase n=1 Tax=Novosphingopyxis iocasae TaxID=2762729 RepID=UPI001FE782C3|nr:alpha/beta hydrolase [Novosphingopyxis iocasae]
MVVRQFLIGLGLLFILSAHSGCAPQVREHIYKPVPLDRTPVTFEGSVPQQVSTTTADGLVLYGYYWAPRDPNGDVVIYFHGNGNNALVAAKKAQPLSEDGHGLLVASYRGYGANPGKPSEEGLIADGDAWFTKAHELAPGSKMFVFGHSLGGAVAIAMGARHNVSGVATLGAFSKLAAMATVVTQALLPDQFDNLKTIKLVHAPIFLFHGTADKVVSFEQAERLAAAAPEAQLLPLPNGGHEIDMTKLAPFVWQAFETGTLDPALLR